MMSDGRVEEAAGVGLPGAALGAWLKSKAVYNIIPGSNRTYTTVEAEVYMWELGLYLAERLGAAAAVLAYVRFKSEWSMFATLSGGKK